MTTPYNTVGYNTETGQPDPNLPAWPDDKLINQVYVAIAARFASTAVRAGIELSNDPGFFKGPSAVFDVVMSCSYQAFEVEYTWFNSTVRDVVSTALQNGTISEIFHGSHAPNSVSGTNPAMLDILDQAAMGASSSEFCHTWENLYSSDIMAVVGGFTSGRSNLLQQIRTPLLVVKIWIPALAFMIACCLTYVWAGFMLALLALQTSAELDVRDAVARLSLFGLADWASQHSHGEEAIGLLREKEVGGENSVVRFVGNPEGGFHFESKLTLDDGLV